MIQIIFKIIALPFLIPFWLLEQLFEAINYWRQDY